MLVRYFHIFFHNNKLLYQTHDECRLNAFVCINKHFGFCWVKCLLVLFLVSNWNNCLVSQIYCYNILIIYCFTFPNCQKDPRKTSVQGQPDLTLWQWNRFVSEIRFWGINFYDWSCEKWHAASWDDSQHIVSRRDLLYLNKASKKEPGREMIFWSDWQRYIFHIKGDILNGFNCPQVRNLLSSAI